VGISSYRDLRVWQAAMDLAQSVYLASRSFPKEETYGLTSQLRRSSVSVPSNIAEGYGRENTVSYVQYLRIAQGSLKELETQIILACRLEYFDSGAGERLLANCEDIGKMLRALIRSLERDA